MNEANFKILLSFVLLSVFFICCSGKKEVDNETFAGDEAPKGTIVPKVIESKDTFITGEEITTKVYLNRTDYKTLALQNGIKDYLRVYYHHGAHINIDSLEKFETAIVEFDTAYITFKPHQKKSEFNVMSYPYDIVIKIDYTDEHDGFDTTFTWRQDALIKK